MRQCLDRRIADRETLRRRVSTLQKEYNETGNTMDWRFTTEAARIVLKSLYPSIQNRCYTRSNRQSNQS